jgi:hypothetical protein
VCQETRFTKIIQPIHSPQHGHDPSVELLDERNLSWISLGVGTRVIDLSNSRDWLHKLSVMSLRLLKHDHIIFLGVHGGGG